MSNTAPANSTVRDAQSNEETKVTVSVHGRNAFVWSAEDVLSLRTKHRIVGSLVGTLPRAPQQNIFFSLPLSLLPEELYVLLSEGLCVLRDDRASHNPPSPGELASFEARERAWADEVMRARVEAARAHREQRSSGRQNGKRTLDLPLNEDNVATAGPTVEERLEERSQNSSSVNPDSMPLRLRTSSAEMPWYHPHKVGGDAFPWPKDRNERNRAQVFYDLWKKGHFLSSGSKFGANYLAYPGDPLRYHSNFFISVVGEDTKLPLMDIVTVGRLGTVVKKNRLLAVANDGDEGPRYYSTEWTGWP